MLDRMPSRDKKQPSRLEKVVAACRNVAAVKAALDALLALWKVLGGTTAAISVGLSLFLKLRPVEYVLWSVGTIVGGVVVVEIIVFAYKRSVAVERRGKATKAGLIWWAIGILAAFGLGLVVSYVRTPTTDRAFKAVSADYLEALGPPKEWSEPLWYDRSIMPDGVYQG